MTPEPVLQIQGLTMAYGPKAVVAQVSLEVAPGTVYALLGRNGAGKSTLIRALLGFEKARAGRLRLFGADAWSGREQTMARIGFVPEVPLLPPRMNPSEAAAFCGRLSSRWDQAEVDARLKRFQVDPKVPFERLSRGQQTQVALALALGSQPEFLVLDDPTLGLDPVARRDLYRELLEDLGQRGTTVFMTTHDLAGIEGLADRVGMLHEGRLLVDEPMESLKDRFRKLHCDPGFPEAKLAPLAPFAMTRSAFGLEATVGRYTPEALTAAGLAPMAADGASLEEIFLAVVSEGVSA